MAQTELRLAFADGEYRFRLGLGQIRAIEEKCGPIGEVFQRLMKGRYLVGGHPVGATAEAAFKLDDVLETVRQGLIGGGEAEVDGQSVKVDPVRASSLLQLYVAERPLHEGWSLAVAIMSALMEGFTPPKAQPAPAGKGGSKKARST